MFSMLVTYIHVYKSNTKSIMYIHNNYYFTLIKYMHLICVNTEMLKQSQFEQLVVLCSHASCPVFTLTQPRKLGTWRGSAYIENTTDLFATHLQLLNQGPYLFMWIQSVWFVGYPCAHSDHWITYIGLVKPNNNPQLKLFPNVYIHIYIASTAECSWGR